MQYYTTRTATYLFFDILYVNLFLVLMEIQH